MLALRVFYWVFGIFLHRLSFHLQRKWLYFFHLNLYTFSLFSCLTALARTSRMALSKKSGEKAHPYLVFDFKKKKHIYFLTIKCNVSCRFFGRCYLSNWGSTPLFLVSWEIFHHEWMWDFPKYLFSIYWYDHMIFLFKLSLWCASFTYLE